MGLYVEVSSTGFMENSTVKTASTSYENAVNLKYFVFANKLRAG
jgi:hypothetical protein